jgi:integrase
MSDRELDSMDGQDKLKYKETISSKESMVNNGLRTIRTMAGLTKPLSTHIARHSFARLAKEVHTDNSLVQGLLLHSSISTTERYMGRFSTDARDDALREIFKPLAPEMVRKRELLKQLAELPEEDLATILEEYKKKLKKND